MNVNVNQRTITIPESTLKAIVQAFCEGRSVADISATCCVRRETIERVLRASMHGMVAKVATLEAATAPTAEVIILDAQTAKMAIPPPYYTTPVPQTDYSTDYAAKVKADA